MSHHAGTPWGKDRHPLLSLEEAWEKIAAEVSPLPATKVALGQAAGRVLAVPIAATEDLPPFDRAMMDGFAVRAQDCSGDPSSLKIVGLASAGRTDRRGVGPGEAMQINTGAPIPAGADAVVMAEDSAPSADGRRVEIRAAVRPEQHISKKGGNRRRGDIVLTPPVRLGPAQIAAAAGAGVGSVEVYGRVGVATVVTGNELVPVGGPRSSGQIYESNGPMLTAMMHQFQARPRPPTIARDTLSDLQDRLSEAMAEPLVISVGGMSMGTLDLVPQALAELGVRWVFHGVAVRPGKPVAYGRGPAGQHVFGLPGNPVSAFVCGWVFVRMVIEGLQGFIPAKPPRRWPVTLASAVDASADPRPAFIPARVWSDTGQGLLAEPCRWAGSADPFGAAAANALLCLPNPTERAGPGSTAEIIPTSELT